MFFDTPAGKKSLSELFDGRSQLIVYHFMLGPGLEGGCPGCSFLSDHIDGALPHLNHHDVTWVARRAPPLPEIEAYKARMGLEISPGCRLSAAASTAISMSPSPRRNWRRTRSNIISPARPPARPMTNCRA